MGLLAINGQPCVGHAETSRWLQEAQGDVVLQLCERSTHSAPGESVPLPLATNTLPEPSGPPGPLHGEMLPDADGGEAVEAEAAEAEAAEAETDADDRVEEAAGVAAEVEAAAPDQTVVTAADPARCVQSRQTRPTPTEREVPAAAASRPLPSRRTTRASRKAQAEIDTPDAASFYAPELRAFVLTLCALAVGMLLWWWLAASSSLSGSWAGDAMPIDGVVLGDDAADLPVVFPGGLLDAVDEELGDCDGTCGESSLIDDLLGELYLDLLAARKLARMADFLAEKEEL